MPLAPPRRLALATAIAALALAAPDAHAQTAPVAEPLPMSVVLCELPVDHPDLSHPGPGYQAVLHAPAPAGFAAQSQGGGATIQVTYNGFSPQAQAAFEAAVDIWEQHVSSTVPIKVTANWTALGDGVLGSAGANFLFSFSGAPFTANTFYGNALADAMAGSDVSPADVEIVANFNSNFASWYFGTDGNTPFAQYDFVSVVLHELGHGLGFFGSGNVDDGTGTAECNGTSGAGCIGRGASFRPVVFDRFVEDAAGTALTNAASYPTSSAALGTALRSGQLYFDGPQATAALGTRGRTYAPASFSGGSSFSHWDEATYPAGNANSLMTPFISNGEAVHSPGLATCGLFGDLGWPLGPACATLVAGEAAPVAAERPYTLTPSGPNPFADRTALRLAVAASQRVRAELFDVMGRRVATLYDGPVAAGRGVALDVEGGSLAAGVYVVRVAGEAFVTSHRLVRSR